MQKRLFFQGDYKFVVELPEQFSCNYHSWTRIHLPVGESDSSSSQAELGVDPGDISWLYSSCPSTGPLPLQRSGRRLEERVPPTAFPSRLDHAVTGSGTAASRISYPILGQ